MGLEIAVCGLAELPDFAPDFGPTHALSLLDPQTPRPEIAGLAGPAHLYLGMNDISSPEAGQEHPQAHHVEALLAWGESLRPAVADGGVRLLVHCWAGVSRSTAAAFTLKCQLTDLSEPEALAYVHGRRRQMWPNALLVELADEALGRQGRMRQALAQWRGGQTMPEGYAKWLGGT